MASRAHSGGSLRRYLLATGLLAACSTAVSAQDAQIEVNPNRPTFASPSLTTQSGVAEVELGVQRTLLRDRSTAFSTPTLLKLGLVKDFELRLSSNGYLRITSPGARTASGLADVALGAQWCFVHGGPLGLDMAVQGTHKFATAGARLGSGEADNSLGLFASRDLGKTHVDLNVFETWLGQASGSLRQPAGAISVSHGFTEAWSVGVEVYALGAYGGNARTVSNLWYVARKVSSRLVVDGGVDIGLSQGAQRYSVFAGLTYGIGRFRKP